MKEKHLVKVFKGNGYPILAKKIGRNDKCQCKSGKKAKNCCGIESEYYHSKPRLRDVMDDVK